MYIVQVDCDHAEQREGSLPWQAWRDILYDGKVLKSTLLPQPCEAGLGLPIDSCVVPGLLVESTSVAPLWHAGGSFGCAGV